MCVCVSPHICQNSVPTSGQEQSFPQREIQRYGSLHEATYSPTPSHQVREEQWGPLPGKDTQARVPQVSGQTARLEMGGRGRAAAASSCLEVWECSQGRGRLWGVGSGPGVHVYSCDGGVRTGEGGSEDQRKMGRCL